jgi:hypothetical protein
MMHREELLRMIQDDWTLGQLVNYITQLRERVVDTQALIKELQAIKRKKSREKQTFENGPRGGM